MNEWKSRSEKTNNLRKLQHLYKKLNMHDDGNDLDTAAINTALEHIGSQGELGIVDPTAYQNLYDFNIQHNA